MKTLSIIIAGLALVVVASKATFTQTEPEKPAGKFLPLVNEPIISEANIAPPKSNVPRVNPNVPPRAGFAIEDPSTNAVFFWHNGFTAQF